MGGAASVDSALKKLEADGLAQAFNMIDKNGENNVLPLSVGRMFVNWHLALYLLLL